MSRHKTVYRCHPEVRDGVLHVDIDWCGRNSWHLPDKSDHDQIQQIGDQAIEWAYKVTRNFLTAEQGRGIRKQLSDAGYLCPTKKGTK